ncbi:hypothetical protein L915_00396 [Phytophthora nicotianae]|uniref:Uncharacterized protein n=1 Tax=Phytophthora nicotianae TaxID=4792 RepID=W2HPD1_PHYNI|nr:hypothetical protein L915_00396 [Phytophthora nicotianae]
MVGAAELESAAAGHTPLHARRAKRHSSQRSFAVDVDETLDHDETSLRA